MILKKRLLSYAACLVLFFSLLTGANLPVQAEFSDVSPAHPDYAGIEFCEEHGIMSGMEDGLFHPEMVLSRGMIATVLYRMAGEPATASRGFSDVPDWSFYKNASTWAMENHIISGNLHEDGTRTFDGESDVLRQDLALIFHRLSYDYIFGWTAPVSPYNELPEEHYAYEAANFVSSYGLIHPIAGKFNGEMAATRAITASLIQRCFDPDSDFNTQPPFEEDLTLPGAEPAQPEFDIEEFEVDVEKGVQIIRGFHDEEITDLTFVQTNLSRTETDPSLEALKEDPNLSALARKRAEEIAVLFEHTRPNGKPFYSDLEGFSAYSTLGENIVMCTFRSGSEAQDWAQRFLELWMNSEGHRANILNERFNALGVGVFILETSAGHYEAYAVQNFGRK